jgi:H+/Cl- antiporter ClcA
LTRRSRDASLAAGARLVALGGLVGIPAAAAAALFLGLSHELQHLLWTDLPDALGESAPPWYLVLGLPVAGGLVVWLARTFLPGDGGHTPIHGIDPEPAPLSHAPGIVVAALGTLGFGLVLGPEAPVIAIGSIVGVAMTWFARLAPRETKVLATAGAFAAISALFDGPIVAGVMLTEAAAPALGAALIPALLPGFVAAAVGYTIFLGFGNWGGLNAPGLAIPNLELYDGARVTDLVVAIAVGAVTAVVITLVRRFATGLVQERVGRMGLAAALMVGGLAVGLIALLADALGADTQDVLFSGQHSISPLITETSTGVVLVLLVAKAIAYAVSLVSGFRGGPIFPAVFLGVGVATLPVVWFGVSPTFAVAAGAAAGMAAYGRFVLTAMLFAALLVGSAGFDAIPGAVLAAAAAWLTVTALDPPAPDGAQPATTQPAA